MAAVATPTAPADLVSRGLSEAEARRRLAAQPPPRRSSSRSYRSIVVANVFTVFNAILIFFALLTLAFGEAADALFLGIVIANTTIGIGQEVRAKRALDRLSALVAPHATVLRDGAERLVDASQVVRGDLVRAGPGDQIVGDGRVVDARGLRVDEAILTGESQPVDREAGTEVRSGSFVVEGTGAYLVTAAGADSYADRLTGEARAFRHPRSPLEHALNQLLLVLVGVLVPLGMLLAATLIARHTSLVHAVPKATAAMVSLVPEGLILLASLTFAVAAVRMARRGVLAQQLNAIESLASADLVCLDKTGTLTDATLRLADVVPAAGIPPAEAERMLATVAAAATHRNLTLDAIAERYPAPRLTASAEVPFISRRRWSGVELGGETLVLGAPELLAEGELLARADAEARAGRRVLVLARAESLAGHDPEAGPPRCEPIALVVLAERLRPETRGTVRYLHEQGVELIVLSGDTPATVAAIAADSGIPVQDGALDGSALPADAGELLTLLGRHRVVGRISPEDKRRVVDAFTAAGRYVAMVGDGVNDVPAMKHARLAIAQGSGAQMAKSVADVVLVSGDFAAIPEMIEQGRQILRNVQRVAKLFVTKSSLAAVLILTVGTTSAAYPFLPRHLTVASTFGVGIPAFFLALAPSSGRWSSEHFLRDVARFAVPAGVALAAGVLTAYLVGLHVLGFDVVEARTAATTVLLAGLLATLVLLERSMDVSHRLLPWLIGAMAVGYAAVLAVPILRAFFELARPSFAVIAAAAAGTAIAVVLARRWLGWWDEHAEH